MSLEDADERSTEQKPVLPFGGGTAADRPKLQPSNLNLQAFHDMLLSLDLGMPASQPPDPAE